MENGRGLYTPVVFTLDDLKEIYDRDSHGKKGMWAFHSKFHDGHAQCAIQTNIVCDWVIGILWNNFAEGMRWMAGSTLDVDDPIRTNDIKVLKESSDVVMVFTGEYHPYKEHWENIKKIFDEEFPENRLREQGIFDEYNLYTSLLYSVAVRLLIHEIYGIKLDYHASCGRDRWRHAHYTEWAKERFGTVIELQDATRDEHGNVLSGMKNRLSPEYKNRIQKPLLLPEFESLEEVNEYIKDIPDLKAVSFYKEFGWIHSKFVFDGKYWWTEGLKCK